MAQSTSTIMIVVIAAVVFVGGLSVGLLVVPVLQGTEEPSGMKIVDDYGRDVTVPQPVERIISLAPSNTEILFALGLDDKVVGVDQASNYPPEAQDKTVVGGYFGGYNLEVITVLDPQLILASSINSDELIGDLENRSFAVVVLDASDIDGVFDDIELVGSITDADAEAEGLVSNLTAKVETIADLMLGVETPSVYVELDSNLWTYGPGTFGDDLLDLAGGENIAGSMGSPWVQLDEEFVVTSSPDIIITVFTPVEEIKARPGWSDISAIQNDKVFAVDGDLISRPGPRIVDGLEELAHLIHPELF
ncbi:MAG: ABC transporter substrate-binding protein [Thermoplasmata archaeon]|nr:ABC transporter substrate-binding protein [Thermoplasmata archaeon]